MLADSRNGPLASLDRSTNAGATAAKEEPNDESPIERSPHRQVLQELLVEHSPSRADMSALAKQCPCAARQVAGACAALIGRPSETLVQGTLWPSELPRFAHSGLVPEATRPFWECTALIKMFCRGDVCTPPWVSALYEDIMRKRARSAAMPFNPPEDEDDTLDLNVVPMEEDEDNGSQGIRVIAPILSRPVVLTLCSRMCAASSTGRSTRRTVRPFPLSLSRGTRSLSKGG